MRVSDAISDATQRVPPVREICQVLEPFFLGADWPGSEIAIAHHNGYKNADAQGQPAAKKSGLMVAVMTNAPLLYSIPDAARRLSVSRSTIYRLINDGALLAVSVRSRQRITAKSLNEFVQTAERARRLSGVRR